MDKAINVSSKYNLVEDKPIDFLKYLDENNIPTTLRQVIIPTLNDNDENISYINALVQKYRCIDSVELLPFKKICKVKYDKMGLNFDFDRYEIPSNVKIEELYKKIKFTDVEA